jgi:hypothetical protein
MQSGTAASTPVAHLNQPGDRVHSFINDNLEERSLNVEIQARQGGDRENIPKRKRKRVQKSTNEYLEPRSLNVEIQVGQGGDRHNEHVEEPGTKIQTFEDFGISQLSPEFIH